jgi:hypothetical protein
VCRSSQLGWGCFSDQKKDLYCTEHSTNPFYTQDHRTTTNYNATTQLGWLGSEGAASDCAKADFRGCWSQEVMAATLHGIQLFPSRLKNIEGNKWQTIIPAARLSSKIILFRVTWITASHDRVAENDVSLQRILIVSIFSFWPRFHRCSSQDNNSRNLEARQARVASCGPAEVAKETRTGTLRHWAKLYCNDKYRYFVIKLFYNSLFVLIIFLPSPLWISSSSNLDSHVAIHPHAFSFNNNNLICLDIKFDNYLKIYCFLLVF